MAEGRDHNPSRPPLCRIVLVTGKGGVGKTTVAAGLAHACAQRDRSSVFAEFGDGESGRRVLGKGGPVEHIVIESQQAILRIATELFHSALLAKVVIGNFAMRRLLRAAPAIRELAQLECVRLVAVSRPERTIVVDMPATGHGIAWLRVPAQLRDMLRTGPLFTIADRLTRELVAPGRCSVVVVTLPERLVLLETIELCDAMARDVGLPPSRLVINRVPAPVPQHSLSEATRVAHSGSPLAEAAGSLVEALASRDQARGDAMAVLEKATEELSLDPILLPAAATDPNASEVATWLLREGAL